jgi:serine/threonine-protein kinase
VAFYAGGALRKTSVHGGLPVRILDMMDFRGGTWGPDDTIVFAPGQVDGLRAISSDGSGERELTVLDESSGEWTHRMPQFLPDGDTVLYTVQSGDGFAYDTASIQAVSLATGEHRDVLDASTYVRYSSAGYLLYVQAGRLLALPFDADALEAVGTAIPLMDGVAVQTNTGAAPFAVADDGTLAFLPGEPMGDEVDLVWVDRDGVTSEFTRDQIVYRHPRFSPDGEQLSIQMIGGGRSGTWISPTDRPGFRSFDPDSSNFLWGPGGEWVVYHRKGQMRILRQPVDRSEEPRVLFEGKESMAPATLTPSGDTLAFTREDPGSGDDIWLVDTDGKQDARPFLQTDAREGGARFSPDGRYLAYVSDATGRFEVMVTSYPEPGSGWQVSIDGGREPNWSPDGHEIFFRSGDKIMAASVQLSPGFRSETPRVLFVGGYEGLLGGLDAGNYDISPDGKRFVIVRSPELQVTLDRIHVVLGWAAALP